MPNEALTPEALFPLIQDFLTQVQSGSQETKKFTQHKFAGFRIEVSFGYGRLALVPWFGFFAEGQTAQCGIFPVCLHYKQHDLFIVAYGVSQEKQPTIEWGPKITNKPKVYDELQRRMITPDYKDYKNPTKVKYGDSFLKACFDNVTTLTDINGTIFSDIYSNVSEILNEYTDTLNDLTITSSLHKPVEKEATSQEAELGQYASASGPPQSYVHAPMPLGSPYAEPDFETISEFIKKHGMVLNVRTLRRYHLSLKTRKFIILAGVSGTGKTWLAELYAQAVKAKYYIAQVAPNWTSNEDLLGYHNPVSNTFCATGFTAFLEEACRAQEATDVETEATPYHLILDEMNLARVEHYFARFLSAMEQRHRGEKPKLDLGPGKTLYLPANLRFIGTVNVDETTHGFADKVFDRAQLIELPLDRELLTEHIAKKPFAEVLMAVWDAVRSVAPFAYRVLDDISDYIASAEMLDVTWKEALDEMIVQKILPRIKGNDSRLDTIFATLDDLAQQNGLKLVLDKIGYMRTCYHEHGFTSFFQ